MGVNTYAHETLLELLNVNISVFQREHRTKLIFWRVSKSEMQSTVVYILGPALCHVKQKQLWKQEWVEWESAGLGVQGTNSRLGVGTLKSSSGSRVVATSETAAPPQMRLRVSKCCSERLVFSQHCTERVLGVRMSAMPRLLLKVLLAQFRG